MTSQAAADDAARVPGGVGHGQGAAQARDPDDPVGVLVERIRPVVAKAVDALQVAASLEADGITDRIARVDYGYADVFALAEAVLRRVGSADATAVLAPPTPGRRRESLRDIAHGLLYLLPAAVFPAALAILGRRSLVLGVVLAGAIGWVWAGGATWLAYRLLGRGYPDSAARILRWSALAGLPVAAAASVAVVTTTHAGYGLTVMAVAQMAYQMASALLVFYRCEIWLAVAMVPAVIAGVGYLVAGPRLLPLAIVVGAGSVVLAFVAALYETVDQGHRREPRLRDGLHGELGQFPLVLVYTALSAVYLLQAQGRYMLNSFDIPLAFVPLIVGMGIVEWRAHRFGEQARALLTRVRYPREFVGRIWLLLAGNVGACLGAVALLGAALVAALRAADLLSPAGMVMTMAGVLLAGAYFVGFLLAGMARYVPLCGALAACTAVHVAGSALPRELSPLADTTVFLASALLLFLLLVTALVGHLGQARYHR